MDVSRPAPGCCKGLSRQQSCYRSAPKLHAASADATFGHRCCYMPRPLCYKVHKIDATRGHRQCYLRPPPLLLAATAFATRSMAPMLPVGTTVATCGDRLRYKVHGANATCGLHRCYKGHGVVATCGRCCCYLGPSPFLHAATAVATQPPLLLQAVLQASSVRARLLRQRHLLRRRRVSHLRT
jgi:hypothetical protein